MFELRVKLSKHGVVCLDLIRDTTTTIHIYRKECFVRSKLDWRQQEKERRAVAIMGENIVMK